MKTERHESRLVQLIPDHFSVDVIQHELPTMARATEAWTYVTHGLQRHQQPEIVFTLVPQLGEPAVVEGTLKFLQAIYESVNAGRRTHPGVFGASLLGRIFVHIPAPKIPNIILPAGAVGAILVTQDELAAVLEFGVTRVMARLGQAACYYPCPFWSDPEREGIDFAQTRQQSILSSVRCLCIAGCQVHELSDRVTLLLTQGTGERLAGEFAKLPDEAAVALLTELDPEADGCAVWTPGQSGPAAIAPEGSQGRQICGCFLLIAATKRVQDGVRRLEDGFGAVLTPDSWRALRAAIVRERSLSIPATDANMSLFLDWKQHG